MYPLLYNKYTPYMCVCVYVYICLESFCLPDEENLYVVMK